MTVVNTSLASMQLYNKYIKTPHTMAAIPVARRLMLPHLRRIACKMYRPPVGISRRFSVAPSHLVQGLSEKDMEDPNIASFLAANFAEIDGDSTDELRDENNEPMAPQAEDKESEPIAARNIRRLSCLTRLDRFEEGSRACTTLREKRLIPGILYGSDPTKDIMSVQSDAKVMVKTPWNQIQRELDRYHHAFQSRVYELTVFESEYDTEGYNQLVVPANLQRHPIQNKLYCVNYLRYHPGRPIKIPIRYINEEESPALKRDGFIVPINRTVECLVEEGAVIPEFIDLECTGLRLKEVVRTERLIFPDGSVPSHRVKPDNFIVGTVFGRRVADDEDDPSETTDADES